MANNNAAQALYLPIGNLKIGNKATFVLFNENPLNDL
jgi:cytosine/adenosine deaminase-related metal-dependent hydrolase